tara:strand:- start:168 stop:1163 length:996 start_codon:yes stop_codon:yes gene_type:complete
MFIVNYFPLIIPIILFPILIYHKEITNATGLIDFPNERKKHLIPISKIGGIYFLASAILTIVCLFNFYNERFIISFIILTSGLFLIGLIDDKLEISAMSRLILQFVIISISIIVDFNLNVENLSIGILSKDIQIFHGSNLFTIFCIISLVNATNLVDGKDGLATSIFIGFIIFFLFFDSGNFKIILINLLLCSFLFLFYNIRGKIYLGNSGSYLIGGIMSFTTIQNYNFNNFNIEIIFIIFYLYGLDMLRVYLERLFRGIHPFTPENNHLHHYIFINFKNKYFGLFVYILLAYAPLVLLALNQNYLLIIIVSFLIYLLSFLYFRKKNNSSV